MTTGARYIADQLQAQGIETVFSVAGASHTRLLDALDRKGIAILSHRHESGAVGAADGFSRTQANSAPQQLGVALIVRDQGLANAVGALAVAQAAGTPLLVLVAALPPGFSGPGPIDHASLAVAKPVAKWVGTVPDAASVQDCLSEAIAAAMNGRPGPAVLAIGQHLFMQEVPDRPIAPVMPTLSPAQPSAVATARAILSASERPLVIAGPGATRGGAGKALRQLAARGVPVLGNASGRGLVAEDDLRGWSWPMAQRLAARADAVFIVGDMLSQRLGFGLSPRFDRHAKMVLVNGDVAGFAGDRPVDAVLGGPLGEALTAVLDGLKRGWSAAWLADGLSDKQAALKALVQTRSAAIHPLTLGKALCAYIGPDTMLVGDGADIQNWMYGVLRIKRPGGFLDHYPLGAMGSGTALAIGAAAALAQTARMSGETAPETILVTGDGSIGFHPGEIHAAVQAKLALKIIIANDGAWGTEKHGQEMSIGRSINTDLGVLPYAKLAEAFGCPGLTCDAPGDLAGSLKALFAHDGPALLDVRIDREAGLALKTNPLINSILFSDIAEGRRALAGDEPSNEPQ